MRIGRTNVLQNKVSKSEKCCNWDYNSSTDKESMIPDQIRVLFQLESKYNSLYVISMNRSLIEKEQHSEWRCISKTSVPMPFFMEDACRPDCGKETDVVVSYC